MVPARLLDVTHELPDTGETVLYDASGQRLLVLNEIGGALWELIDGERSTAQLADEVAAAFDEVPRDRIETDVNAFLAALLEHGVIRDAA